MVFVLPPAGVIAAIPAEVCWPRLPAYVPAELEPAGAAMLVPALKESLISCRLGAKVGENKVALLSVFQSPSCASHWQDLI